LPCEENFSCDIDNKDTLKNILCYLNTLTKKERDVIIYRIWYDLSFSEISEILGLSLDNCKKISSRTLKKISANFLSFLFIFLIF
jgi:sigma-70, region 4